MNLNKCISRYFYQAAGAEWLVGAASMERPEAVEIPSVDHPELSNQLPAALPYSVQNISDRKWNLSMFQLNSAN